MINEAHWATGWESLSKGWSSRRWCGCSASRASKRIKVYGDISVSRADGGIEIDLRVVNDREAVLADVKSTLKDSVVVLNQTPFAPKAG